jgi:hypothetical protein
VGCALGFGDGDDVVAFGCCVLGELAFFYGEGLGEFVLDAEGLGNVGLGGWLVFFFFLLDDGDDMVLGRIDTTDGEHAYV